MSQVEARAAFAQRHFRDDAGFVPVRWIDAQDVRAVAGEKAARDGSCQNACQVEHANARQRSSAVHLPCWRSDRLLSLQAAPAVRPASAMPCGCACQSRDGPHRGRAAAGFDDGGLQRGFRPAFHRDRHRFPVRLFSQHPLRCRAMVRRVRVQPDPAVARRIVAGDRIPRCGQRPADRPDRRSKPERRETTIDATRGIVPLRNSQSSATASDAAAIDALARSVTRNAKADCRRRRSASFRVRRDRRSSAVQIDAVRLVECSAMTEWSR